MTNGVDFSQLVPLSSMSGEDQEDTRLLRETAAEAKKYLSSFSWCAAIQGGWFGWGVGGIGAVFLFEIVPSSEEVDKLLWIIAGDLPPAYLVVDENPRPLDALRTYAELMQEWVDAVRDGRPIDSCIPVNASATLENAEALQARLDFIRREFLSAPQ